MAGEATIVSCTNCGRVYSSASPTCPWCRGLSGKNEASGKPSSDEALPEVAGLADLFDLSFDRFGTVRIARFCFVLGMIVSFVIALGVAVEIYVNYQNIPLAFVVGLLAWVMFVMVLRIWTEFLVVVFRVAENTAETARLLRQRPKPA